MSLIDWIQEQYKNPEKSLPHDKVKRLELISEYEGFESPVDFVASIVKMEIPHYERDLRFGRWLRDKGIK